jgi:hypothetical protein
MTDRPKSPLGAAIFGMLTDMTRAQARVYRGGGTEQEAARAARIAHARHKPIITNAIIRPSQRKLP